MPKFIVEYGKLANGYPYYSGSHHDTYSSAVAEALKMKKAGMSYVAVVPAELAKRKVSVPVAGQSFDAMSGEKE